MSRTPEAEEAHLAVFRLSRAMLALCAEQETAVAGVAVLYTAIALRQGDSGQTMNGAIELLRSQLESMKEPGVPS